MSAFSAARTDWTGYSGQRDLAYGDYQNRLSRYALARSYFANTQYDELSANAARLRTNERLYRFIRSIINPVELQNNLITSYAYPGTIDTDDLTKGALPLVYDNKAMEAALQNVIQWSNLDTQLGSYVSKPALLGDVFWLAVDDPQRRRVRLDLQDPAFVKYIERDEVGNIKSAVIEYEYDDEPEVERYQPGRAGSMELRQTKKHVKTLILTKDRFSTFRDGAPFGYYFDASGNPIPEWDNDYGFVPLIHAYFAEGEDGWGRNSFFGIARRQIDELNDQASIINDAIRNVVAKPLLKARGIAAASEISVKTDERDNMSIVYISNADGDIEPLVIPLNVADAAANRDAMLRQLESNMPELSLARVRDIGGNLSGTAIENMFGDAISRMKQVRKNLDPPLARAIQMAVTMGGIRGYDGFEAFNADSYDRGDMALRIADRPVIDDTLSKSERITALSTVKGMSPSIARLTLEELGYSEKDVEAVVADLQQASAVQPPQTLGANDPTQQGNVPPELASRLQGQQQIVDTTQQTVTAL